MLETFTNNGAESIDAARLVRIDDVILRTASDSRLNKGIINKTSHINYLNPGEKLRLLALFGGGTRAQQTGMYFCHNCRCPSWLIASPHIGVLLALLLDPRSNEPRL
jgi:hypothetical protein